MTDPITDMLNQIRNAKAVEKQEISVLFSKLKHEIAMMLAKEGFIKEAKKVMKGKTKMIKMVLQYDNGMSAIEGIKRVSKPGQRIYVKSMNIKKVRGGFGISIISTPKGLMTNNEAKKAKLGGEVICEVW
jgi:small subunit ribosomal protein S8